MANRRIEYVFGPPRPSTGHCLGVSNLALTTDISLLPQSYGTLFTGGRDGRINAWGLTPQQGTQTARVSDHHTSWVSDLRVVSNDSIVSCSADTTVKHWNVVNNSISTIGHHTDYAQCLAQLSASTIVSGGLDERILGWDLNRPGGPAQFDIHAGHSVYAIATASPNLVVCGASDGAVRIWDTRQSHYIAKFTGHTDSVRSLYVNNGDTVVSGASDATVRVWDLKTGRVFKTLNQFQSSVWSLQPFNNGFLAGDRNGNIYQSERLDQEPRIVIDHAVPEGGLKGICCDPVTSNLWVGTPFNPDVRCINPQSGNEVERLRGHKGLRKHRLMNDKRRALVVDTDGDVGMVDLISARSIQFKRHIDLSRGQNIDTQLDEILEEVNTMDVLDNWCQVQTRAGQFIVTLDHRSINNAEVYLDDLTDHVAQSKTTAIPTPVVSPVSTPFGSPQSSGFFRQNRKSPFVSPAVSRVTSAQSLAEIASRERQRAKAPALGTGQGHARFYDPDDETEDEESSRSASASARSETRRGGQSQQPSTRSGVGAAAGSTKNQNIDAAASDQEEPADNETADDEIRINLGNFVLENLLRGVVLQLRQEYARLPEPPSRDKAGSRSMSPAAGHGGSSASSTTNNNNNSSRGSDRQASSSGEGRERKRTRFFNKIFGKKSSDDQNASSASSTTTGGGNDGNNNSSSAAGSATDSAAGSENPQIVKQRIQQQNQNEPDSSSFQEAWSRAVAHRSLQQADPESPDQDVLSPNARLVITEIAPGAGAPTEIFSTTVGKLIDNKQEVANIEKVLPGWVGDALLLGKLNLKQATKIGFAVVPQDPDMPELTPESTRLMAISMLRARKIMAYTVGQLQQQELLAPSSENDQPEDLVTLTCEGVEVTPHMTLATIRTRIWRKGGDVVMHYAIKKSV